MGRAGIEPATHGFSVDKSVLPCLWPTTENESDYDQESIRFAREKIQPETWIKTACLIRDMEDEDDQISVGNSVTRNSSACRSPVAWRRLPTVERVINQ